MKPTAAARTISIFTGKTDSESPRARDGSYGEPKPGPGGPKPLPRWVQFELSEWNRPGQQIRVVDGVYYVTHRGEHLGSFSNLIDAARAADEAMRK